MKISIVIPVYNAGDYISETLNSILNQNYDNYEIILIDDGSTDKSKEVIESFASDKIKYYYQENSGGPASPRNFGIKKSQGDLVSFFDSDDIMLPNKLLYTAAVFESNPNLNFLFTNFKSINEKGEVLKSSFLDDYSAVNCLAKPKDPSVCAIIASKSAYNKLIVANYIGTSGVTLRRSSLDKLGGFDVTLANGDDRDMWFRATRNYDIGYLSTPLHCYRIRIGSISFRSAEKNSLNRIKVLSRQLNFPQDPGYKKELKKRIAENYFSVAYEQFWKLRNKKGSIIYLVQAMKFNTTLNSFKLLLSILLGKKLSFFMKNKMKATD